MANPDLSLKLKPSSNPVAAYAEAPRYIHFQDQEADEDVELLLRRHFVTNTRWILLVIVGFITPSILSQVDFSQSVGLVWVSTLPPSVTMAGSLIWYIIFTGIAIESFMLWYFNVYLISNRRLIDVDFLGLLHYRSTETQLTKIEDVSHRRGGIWQAIFNYGTVNIQTAATEQNVIFEFVPKPARVADIITDLIPTENDRTYKDLDERDAKVVVENEDLV